VSVIRPRIGPLCIDVETEDKKNDSKLANKIKDGYMSTAKTVRSKEKDVAAKAKEKPAPKKAEIKKKPKKK
jgi:hypothetical protein